MELGVRNRACCNWKNHVFGDKLSNFKALEVSKKQKFWSNGGDTKETVRVFSK